MNTSELLQEIKKLPVRERILIAEKTIKSIRELEESQALSIAAEALYNEYATNKELTPFTNIDFEDFYETRWDLAFELRPYFRCRNKENETCSDCKWRCSREASA